LIAGGRAAGGGGGSGHARTGRPGEQLVRPFPADAALRSRQIFCENVVRRVGVVYDDRATGPSVGAANSPLDGQIVGAHPHAVRHRQRY